MNNKVLYFTSAKNYHVWMELVNRAKIHFEVRNFDEKITETAAIKLKDNLNCSDNQKIINNVISYFKGRTKKEIYFSLKHPGSYRLRAANVDMAGRTAVTWKIITVPGK